MPDKDNKYISATQMVGLMGVSPYMTPYTLYHQFKNNLQPIPVVNEHVKWGLKKEGLILEAIGEKLNKPILRNINQEFIKHPNYPIGCTLDGEIPSIPAVIEAKSVSKSSFLKNWTPDKIPDFVEMQVQCQMLVTGYKVAYVGCLADSADFHIYLCHSNSKIHVEMLRRAEEFFEYVRTSTSPPLAPKGHLNEFEFMKSRKLYNPSLGFTSKKDVTEDDEFYGAILDYELATNCKLDAEKIAQERRAYLLLKYPNIQVLTCRDKCVMVNKDTRNAVRLRILDNDN